MRLKLWKQDFWRGCYKILLWLEIKLHKITLFFMSKVDYNEIVKNPYFGSERHPFRNRR